jgi:hypothetical protein
MDDELLPFGSDDYQFLGGCGENLAAGSGDRHGVLDSDSA